VKSILMTGATSGLGYTAATMLLNRGNELTVGARDDGAPNGARTIHVELADMANVRAFAAQIIQPIDALVFNAGLQRTDIIGRTAEGFEMTFGVNHLSHYLLARLLLPKLKDGGRIILTTSGTHDPAEKTGMPAPRHADAGMLANPDSDSSLSKSARTAGLRAYSSSKLANLMTARILSGLSEVTARKITVHAFDPGLTPGTGLARNHSAPIRAAFKWMLPLFRPFAAGMNSLEDAGFALAGLADGSIDSSRTYMALRRGKATWPEPSELARNDIACQKLWDDSAVMVGLV
jgi:NAD(P)-dependent dehydrogenase (short-subunit alcohol dehydrogenase family)